MALGEPLVRDTARAKVTGQITYPIDATAARMTHARLVGATIAKGRLASIDTREAQRVPGVIRILTYRTMPPLAEAPTPQAGQPGIGMAGLMQDDRISYAGQTIAVVIAETALAADTAAMRVRATYEAEEAVTELSYDAGEPVSAEVIQTEGGRAVRGDPDAALKAAEVVIDAEYETPMEHHNPIGLFATLAHWEGPDRLFLHDTSQGPHSSQEYVAQTLGVPVSNVRAISPFVGGAFGAAIRPRQHVALAAVAAREVGRPVSLALSRADMFTKLGHRSQTIQRVRLGADGDGRLTAIAHEGLQHATAFSIFKKDVTAFSRLMYACPNVRTTMEGRRIDLNVASWMRAPGEAPGLFASESAMDELARELNIDPVELRLRNYAEVDPDSGNPWGSNATRAAYALAGSEFGWDRYMPEIGAQRSEGIDDRLLVGWGMAGAIYGAYRFAGGAEAVLYADGSAMVRCGMPDIGAGAYTVLRQIAADALGLPVERVTVRLGDSSFPESAVQGASAGTSSAGSAVLAACERLVADVIALVPGGGSALAEADSTDLRVVAGGLASGNGAQADWGEVLGSAGQTQIGARVTLPGRIPGEGGVSNHAFGALFAEVTVDPDTMEVRVPRMVGAYGIGRALNPRMVRSQFEGSMVWGIGMALMEETVVDHNLHRMVNADLAEYHVPACADIRQLRAFILEEEDTSVNPMGAKGCGEIAMAGTAAAIANAVHHATGARLRSLPITPAKLFEALA